MKVAQGWQFSDGTGFQGQGDHPTGGTVNAEQEQDPRNMDVYFIAHEKCTECVGFHDEPQCAAVCPVDCCVDDPEHRESEELLLAKKSFLHL